ncbi:MAG: hypothetical protein IPH16_16110 [Haliscomenobacter sp.]|nr:hypothetical protein [Haliscomenobacter sp.]
MTLQNDAGCLEVMTGAVMPLQADTVIRYEDLDLQDGMATVLIEDIARDRISRQGIDRKRAGVIVAANTRIGAPEIGIGSSIGKARVTVAALPKVMIISTGDELVEITRTPEPYQIRRSNEYRMLTTLQAQGIQADADHLPDDPAVIREKLAVYLDQYDALILSGGVSKGKFDFLPEALEGRKLENYFTSNSATPGQPFWFWKYQGAAPFCRAAGQPGLFLYVPPAVLRGLAEPLPWRQTHRPANGHTHPRCAFQARPGLLPRS